MHDTFVYIEENNRYMTHKITTTPSTNKPITILSISIISCTISCKVQFLFSIHITLLNVAYYHPYNCGSRWHIDAWASTIKKEMTSSIFQTILIKFLLVHGGFRYFNTCSKAHIDI